MATRKTKEEEVSGVDAAKDDGTDLSQAGVDTPYLTALSTGKRTQAGAAEAGGDSSSTYYDDLRTQNYVNLLDTQISLASAKQNAAKATTNTLQAMGLGGTGYASTAANGIGNSYLQALASAQNSYNEQNLAIGDQEKEAAETEAADNFNVIQTFLNNASTTDQMNDVLANYGITVKDGILSGGDLTSSQLQQLQTYYSMAKDSFNGIGNGAATANDFEGTTGAGVDVWDSDWGVGDELNYIFSKDAMSSAKEGDALKLVNGHQGSGKDYVYVVYHNGKWYQTNAAGYSGASRHGVLKGAGSYEGSYDGLFN